eukprot:CFRG1044T1
MAPKKLSYGVTPWGNALLEAMNSLGGRLERGKTLARTGKVYDTSIRGNEVSSRCKGSYSPYYDVGCTWPLYTGEEKNAIVGLIQQNPQYLGEILRGNLPLELIEKLQRIGGTPLLPTSYRQLNGECNCPDNMGGGGCYGGTSKKTGDPCKHQAGLFYMIIEEVDKNPFTLFSLHGLDLMANLGMGSVGQGSSLVFPFSTDSYDVNTNTDADGTITKFDVHGNINFPQIRNVTPFVSKLLSDNPVFDTTGNFKAVLLNMYHLATAKTKSSKMLLAKPAWACKAVEEDWERLEAILTRSHFSMNTNALLEVKNNSTFVTIENALFATVNEYSDSDSICIDRRTVDYRYTLTPIQLDTALSCMQNAPVISLDTFLILLLQLKSGDAGTPSYKFFWYCARQAFLFVTSGCFLPTVVPSDTEGSGMKWVVRYRPLTCNTAVAESMKGLCTLYPMPIDGTKTGMYFNSSLTHDTSNISQLAPIAGTHIVVSLFITMLMNRLNSPGKNTPLHATFFKGAEFMALTLGQKSIGRSVVNWLAVFNIVDFEYDIELCISPVADRDDHDFSIQLTPKTTPDTKKTRTLNESVDERSSVSLERIFHPHVIIKNSPRQAPHIMQLLSALGEYIPNIGELMKRASTRITMDQFENLVLNSEPILTVLGVKLTIPKGILKVLKPRLVMVGSLESENDDDMASTRTMGYLDLAELLTFKPMIALGDVTITPEEFEDLLDVEHKLVAFREAYIELNASEVRSLLKRAREVEQQEMHINPMDLLKTYFGGLSRLSMNMFLGSSEAEMLDRILRVDNLIIPGTLNATLRPYQERGLSWIVSNITKVGGCILADDMGLGKTIQVIVTLLHLKATGMLSHDRPALVVAPASLLTNWAREFEKFAATLHVKVHHGVARDIRFHKTSKVSLSTESSAAISEEANRYANPNVDVKPDITSDIVAKKRMAEMNTMHDANSSIKRVRTNDQLKAMAIALEKTHLPEVILTSYGTIKTDAKLFAKFNMSIMIIDEAQAIKNHKSQVSKICKQVSKTATARLALSGTPVENRLSELHSLFDFILPHYLGTLKSFIEDFAKPIEIHRDTDILLHLKKLTTPFILRRLKSNPDIACELPPKVETIQYARLSPRQAALYQAVTDDILARIDVAKEEGLPTPGLIFKLLVALKQICNHPDNYTADDDAEDEGDTKEKGIGDRGNVHAPVLADSGKMQLLMELLNPILASGEKVLIFTQYVRMAHLLREMIANALYVNALVFSGSIDMKKRDYILRLFERDPASQIMILSLKAGGIGLNLTQANHVIHYDRWFNPAVENQASDRAFRIGQTKRVFIHKFVCQNTFEDKINDMIVRKQELSDLAVTAGEKWIGRLDSEELRDLFKLAPGYEQVELH